MIIGANIWANYHTLAVPVVEGKFPLGQQGRIMRMMHLLGF